jgi:hypothetical protein
LFGTLSRGKEKQLKNTLLEMGRQEKIMRENLEPI